MNRSVSQPASGLALLLATSLHAEVIEYPGSPGALAHERSLAFIKSGHL